MTVNADAAFSPEWRVGAVWLLEQFDSGETWFHVADLTTVMGCYPVWPDTGSPKLHKVASNLIRCLRKKNAVGRKRNFSGYPVKDAQTGYVSSGWATAKILAEVMSFDGCPDRKLDGRREIKPGIRDVVATYCVPVRPDSSGLRKLVTVDDVAEMLVDVEAKTLHNSDVKKWGAPDGKVNRSRAWDLDRIRPIIEKTRQFKDV